MTIYTVIVGPYDDLKQPFVVTPGWKYICFTDQDFKLPDNNIWEIRKVDVIPSGRAKTQREIKINFHKYIEDDFSIYIDGTFIINCNLDDWWSRFVPPFTTIKHPFDDCIYTDVRSCLTGKKADAQTLRNQSDSYRRLGVKKNGGLIASGILMRQKTPDVIEFCVKWWGQVYQWTHRDQIAFGLVNHRLPNRHTSIEWDYTTMKEFIHIPHIHKPFRNGRLNQMIEIYGSNKTG
jgi:hypothetical protein